MPKPLKKGLTKRPRRPIDPNLLARQLVEDSTREAEIPSPVSETIAFKAQLSAYMRKLGAKGGRASGATRNERLSVDQRREIAASAARKRWDDVAKRKNAKPV